MLKLTKFEKLTKRFEKYGEWKVAKPPELLNFLDVHVLNGISFYM